MSAASSRSRRSTAELVDVAMRHYELGEPVDSLAADRGVDQSTIRRWLSRAKKEGLIRTLVIPPLNDEENTNIRQDVRYAFELEDVITVPGREDILSTVDESEHKEALVLSIAQEAARYLEDHLTNKDILLVPWGRMANYIARQIRAPRPLPGLRVVPMEGVLGVQQDPFEANILASGYRREVRRALTSSASSGCRRYQGCGAHRSAASREEGQAVVPGGDGGDCLGCMPRSRALGGGPGRTARRDRCE